MSETTKQASHGLEQARAAQFNQGTRPPGKDDLYVLSDGRFSRFWMGQWRIPNDDPKLALKEERLDGFSSPQFRIKESHQWTEVAGQTRKALASEANVEVAGSAFKPSFANPAVWTDELIVQRHAEFAAFQKTDAGRAEDAAFDKAYSEYEMRREFGADKLQRVQQSLEELRAWPASARVSDLYDTVAEFRDAIRGVFGQSFEYPDFSHRTVGQTVARGTHFLQFEQSRIDAAVLAAGKAPLREMSAAKDERFVGKVMAITESHVAISLGRAATILAKQDLDRVPAVDETVSVKWESGRGTLSPARTVATSLAR